MYLCVCKAVEEETIQKVIDRGAKTIEEIGEACSAGEGCGSCHYDIEKMLDASKLTSKKRK